AARPGAVWLVDREGGRPDAVPLETGADRAGRAPGLGRRSMPAGAGYTPRSTPWGVGEDTAERTPAGGPLAIVSAMAQDSQRSVVIRPLLWAGIAVILLGLAFNFGLFFVPLTEVIKNPELVPMPEVLVGW